MVVGTITALQTLWLGFVITFSVLIDLISADFLYVSLYLLTEMFFVHPVNTVRWQSVPRFLHYNFEY